jgi:hypothetical protein
VLIKEEKTTMRKRDLRSYDVRLCAIRSGTTALAQLYQMDRIELSDRT